MMGLEGLVASSAVERKGRAGDYSSGYLSNVGVAGVGGGGMSYRRTVNVSPHCPYYPVKNYILRCEGEFTREVAAIQQQLKRARKEKG